MTRFLKRAHEDGRMCGGCCFDNMRDENGFCGWTYIANRKPRCGWGIFILVPRPPDGTRCRDLDGNIRVVGRDL